MFRLTRRDHVKRIFGVLIILGTVALGVAAQQAAPPVPLPPPREEPSAEFLQEADEVLARMSKLLCLPILSPLKKSLRTRDEIRDYLLRKMNEDRDANKRYADRKTMEKLGLLPKDYPLEETLVKVLTEQIAGLYDPDSREFFVADWTAPADQREVMAHELTHALQDQHFHIEKWSDAAKANDDAELARDAVVEGSAMAGMLDYLMQGNGSIRDLGETDFSAVLGDADGSPELASAPKVLRDELLFPYLAGTSFTLHVLKASNGWSDFHKVYENPPVSTQQIMHPDMYLHGFVPPTITLPEAKGLLSADCKKLDENRMGEFGLKEIFGQFLRKDRAASLAAAWSSDRYAIFENQKDKRTILEFRVRLASDADAARFFGGYSEVLELKYDKRTNLMRRPNFFSFDTPEEAVFLRCVGIDCFILEGGSRAMFDRLIKEMGWPVGPPEPVKAGESFVRAMRFPVLRNPVSDVGQPTLPTGL
jgi:hypothetical protein